MSSDFQAEKSYEIIEVKKNEQIINSIAKYFEFRFPKIELGISLYISKPSLWKALFVVLLRKTFPESYIEILDL